MLSNDGRPDAMDAQDDALTTASLWDEGGSRHRASLVLLFNGRREVILRRVPAPGRPHGGAWACGIETPVDAGESYATAAARATRETLRMRIAPPLRFLDKTWLDEPGARVFLGVFAAAYDGPTPEGATALPIVEVTRAMRRTPELFCESLTRAFRLLQGDETPEW